MDVERSLQDKPVEVVALYHRLIELAEACGPFTYAVAKTAVSLKVVSGGFAGAAPTMKALDGHFDLRATDLQTRGSGARRPTQATSSYTSFWCGRSTEPEDECARWITEAFSPWTGWSPRDQRRTAA